MIKRIALALGGLLLLLILYLTLWPVSIDPAAWTPPPAPPLEGMYAPNDYLAAVERIGEGAGVGPEDVDVDAQGRIYGGMEDGRIMRFQPDGSQPELFADTGGRPLGMDFDNEWNLIVADAYKGLLSIAPDGGITVLATEHDGVPFGTTDDVDVASDGMIYFSDATYKFSLDDYTADLLEHRPNGRLLAYDPASGETALLLDGLYFANGVAVSPDESFVVVVETGAYRVMRYWLTGPRAGESEVFIDNLPGFPDTISCDGEDTFWLALVSPRKPDIDTLVAPNPFLARMVIRLPEALLPKPEDYGFVLGLDVEGQVAYNLQDPAAGFRQITSVEEEDGYLYLGSLAEDAIGRVPAP